MIVKQLERMRYHNDVRDSKFRFFWLQLARSQNIGARTFWELLKIFHTPQIAIDHIPRLVGQAANKGASIVKSAKEIEQEIINCKNFQSKIILACDDMYPQLLLQTADPPPVLVTKGNVDLLNMEKFAIVGARNASINGCNFAKNIATDLGEYGYIIISGLAKGIDAAAHIGSIERGTIGVIASGIDHVYPHENTHIYKLLYEKGLVLSEYAFGQMPIAKHFPQRNRIISGLSHGVLIVEAAKKSGTLLTARFALEQGRDVFAVPGYPVDKRCQGTNSLIKQGAVLVENAEDIVSTLQMTVQRHAVMCSEPHHYSRLYDAQQTPQIPSLVELAKYKTQLLQHLSYHPTSIEELIEISQIPQHIIHFLILELELLGKVERTFGNAITLLAEF